MDSRPTRHPAIQSTTCTPVLFNPSSRTRRWHQLVQSIFLPELGQQEVEGRDDARMLFCRGFCARRCDRDPASRERVQEFVLYLQVVMTYHPLR